jgi:chaperonin cofactor prefoldin|tara:strand:- start:1229 stop:1648 length:420 start_codon:yes stop_codon:yes gene_type:complete
MNEIKTLHELAKENPDKTYKELEKIKEEKEKIQEDEKNYYQTGMVYVPREDELKYDDRGLLDLTKQIEDLNKKITDLLNENDSFKDLIRSRDYTRQHDYKFLVDENKKLHKEIDELRRDNKMLTHQVDDQIARARKAGL